MDALIATFLHVLDGMTHFLFLLIGLFIAKLFYDWTTPYKFSHELTEKDNPAVGVSLAGYLIGAGIALGGALYSPSMSLLTDFAEVTLVAITTIVLMRISVYINDLAILHSFKITKELVTDRNTGVGFVVAGSSIATGLMLNGVLSGHSPTLAISIRDICVYWAVGQTILVLGGLFFQMITPYDVHHIIGEEDNMPVGISFGGFLVALGIITRNALYGASSNLADETIVTLTLAICGLLLMVATRVIVDRVFLPNSPLAKEVVQDRNAAAGAIAAVSFIVVALLFSASVNTHSPFSGESDPVAMVKTIDE